MAILLLLICLAASMVGAICGIGGGVIIKPVLDLLKIGTPAEINFLSGCTVLSMSLYSVCRSLTAGDRSIQIRTGMPLAIGAAVGGVAGKELFSAVRATLENSEAVSGVQAIALGIITVGTLLYTIFKANIRTHSLSGTVPCVGIGLLLGIMSSFLGIGGGPINLVVLGFFFSLDSKSAASGSLFVILFSQAASLITTLATGSVPEFKWITLVFMVIGGLGGGVIGRMANKKMSNRMVDKLFIVLMIVIVGICIFNGCRAFF